MGIKTIKYFDQAGRLWMKICLIMVLLIPFLILIGLLFKSQDVLTEGSLVDLLFSSEWKPLQGRFGFLPFILSSIYVSLGAILLAVPLCLLTAIYLTQYARRRLLKRIHPFIDILAGIPSVIYGLWGILFIVPLISRLANLFGYHSSGYSALSAAVVLAVMIIPFILNIMLDVFRSLPAELTEASLAMGATRWQTVKKVLLRKARPALVSAVVFGLARAFGETIAVLMVVGNRVHIPKSPFDEAYPIPSLIANNYGEMLSIPRYESALMFAALLLFVIVLIFNVLSRSIISGYELHRL